MAKPHGKKTTIAALKVPAMIAAFYQVFKLKNRRAEYCRN